MNQQSITPPYYVELLTRDNATKARHRFTSLPIKIGRGYDNDLIIDDPYMEADHAIIDITAEGSLQIRDLDSKNGLHIDGQKQQTSPLNQDHVIRLGHTKLRIRHAGFDVGAALTDKAAHHQWEGWLPALIGMGLIILSAIASTWLSAFDNFSLISSITTVAPLLLMVLLWCGGWAFATRLINGTHSRFGRHILIAGCAAILLDIVNLFNITIAYTFSISALARYSSMIAAFIFAGMILFHLTAIYHQRSKRIVYSSLAVAILGVSLIFMTNYQKNGMLADARYMTYILPTSFHLSSDMAVDDFITEAEHLKPALAEARKKPANKRGLLGN